jgi:zinc protease
MYVELAHTAEGIMADKVVAFMHSDDSRFGFPANEVMQKRTLAELAAWMKAPLSEGYLEVSIVGDVQVPAVMQAVAKTLGALPARAVVKPAYAKERSVPFPKGPSTKDISFSTEIPKAISALYWPTGDMLDIKRTRRLSLLGAVLDDRLRLKVREELGETYSPACYHVASDTFTDYGYMTAMIECKPEQAAPITTLVTKKPLLTQLEQMRRDNRYWSQNVVRNCQEHPERIGWAKSLLSDFQGITKEEVQALAKQFLGMERAVAVKVLPNKKS